MNYQKMNAALDAQEARKASADCAPAPGSATVECNGYYVELAENGPWLTKAGMVGDLWESRGIWTTREAAQAALARSQAERQASGSSPAPGSAIPAFRRIRCGSMGGIDCTLELGHSGPCQTKYD